MAYPLVLLSLPVTVGIAILRSRLYDIDVLINRTLVYGTLTVMLALVYFGLVIGGQHLLVSLLGQSNARVLVVSTLIVAPPFPPPPHRIQRTGDPRFYPPKCDPPQILPPLTSPPAPQVSLN